MFDTIDEKLFCPFCGFRQEANSFQSKDTGDLASQWTFKEIISCFDKKERLEIHSECDKCKKWISINIIVWRLK